MTREHVLPRGLGGGDAPVGRHAALVLQEASCEKCRAITQNIERECLRDMMEYGRSRLGLKRKDRRKSKTKAFVDLLDGSSEEREINSDEILGPVILPSYYEAAALSNKPLTNSVPCPCDHKMIVIRPASAKALANVARLGVSLRSTPKTFARMLAKIALGLTVAHLGIDGFVPTVRNFILRNPDQCGYWVGGYAGTDKAYPTSGNLHHVVLRLANLKSGDFIVVELQLFAEYGGPNNYVVVGRAL